jgi:hypothetical protein
MDHPDTKHQRLVAENANGFKYRKHLHCGASTCPFQQEIESKNERQQGEGNAVSLPPSLPPSDALVLHMGGEKLAAVSISLIFFIPF